MAETVKRDRGRKEIEKKNSVLEQLKIEYVEHGSIKPNSYNPNRQSDHDFELLLRSMREDGFTQPIVCVRVTADTIKDPAFSGYGVGDVVIVDGEHRWRAAGKLGFAQVPVVITTMTPEQMRIATLRHNRARGSEDIELSAQVLRDLRALGALDWAQDSLMLSDAEMDKLMEDIPAPEALAAPEFSEAWAPTRTVQQGVSADGQVTSMTPAAIEAMREQEKKIASAKTEEERIAAQRDANIYRLVLVFTGDEAKAVREALEPRPAERILALCRGQAGGQ